MLDVSIIIVNWKSTDYLCACLDSLGQYLREVSYEIIVVDNHSDDNCETVIGKKYPEVQLILSKENLGFARANNLGAQGAKGKYLLFMNPDTEIHSDAISGMVCWMQGHSEAGAVSALLRNTDGTVQESCVQTFPTILNQVLDANVLRRMFPRSKLWGTEALHARKNAVKAQAISGACFMTSRIAFDAVNGFCEEYFMYSDDLDLSYRIRKVGYEIYCLTQYEVTHHGGKSSSHQFDGFEDLKQRESMEQFLCATRGPSYSRSYRRTMAFAACVRLILIGGLLTIPRQGERRGRLLGAAQKWWCILAWGLRR